MAAGGAPGPATLTPYHLPPMNTAALTLSLAAHLGLAALVTPAAPVGVALLVICTPAALAAHLAAARQAEAQYWVACGRR